jgi:hypothetical protein
MANTVLTPSIIAKRALVRLENELGVLNMFHRAYEDEFASKVNGYKKGDTISIRRPVDYTLRSGAVMDLQDSIEGKVDLVIDQQKGVDMSFTSKDMTLSVSEFDERFIKSAVSTIVNGVAADCLAAFLPTVYNYVGTPNTAVDSLDDFLRVSERMNYLAIPMDDRNAIMNPTDHARMTANLGGLYIQSDAKGAYRDGDLGRVGGISTMMTQIITPQDYGTVDNTTPLTDGNSQEVTYDTAKNTWTQTLLSDGWATTKTLLAGQVFTIAGVYMVNPRTKVSTGILQQFTVVTGITTAASGANNSDFTISPPIITSGPHQTVTYSGNFDGLAITIIGPASGTAQTYRQNVAFGKGAFALAMAPMEMPQAVGDRGARESYKGLSIRLVPVYDGVNDVEKWRLDVLYGRKTIDPRLAVRFSGT